ncbi:MAG: hypothetical protein KatS3mg036_0253 [Ignavibacterium sp.]|nr:MAG: hypothetical protein KatS3mg036_0253 [Ignavibacterium sp.]
MKLKTKNLRMILICSIIISTAIHSQEQPQNPDFTYGVFSHLNTSWNYQNAKAYLDSAGFNYIIDGIIPDTTTALNQNLIGIKESSPQDYIGYYSKGYYSKWEAERNEFVFGRVGFKHPHKNGTPPYLYGQVETHLGAKCWATQRDIGHRVDSVLWGPHYHQDKKYDYGFWDPNPKITYIASYRMAFSNIPQKSQDDEVCKMKVTYSYRYGVFPDTHIVVIPLNEKLLRVRDFPADSSFRNFTISYQLPDGYIIRDRRMPENIIPSADTLYEDDVVLSGIEFKLEWSGIGKLYIDYVEVYDSTVWGQDFMMNPQQREITVNRIKNMAQQYGNISKLKYWYVNDEPNSIDTYLPMRIVDSLLNTVTPGKNTITEIYPNWRGEFNGEHHLKQFVQVSNTKKLMIDHYPAYTGQAYWEGLDYFQNSLQWAWEAQPNFWYVAQAQALGQKLAGTDSFIELMKKPEK